MTVALRLAASSGVGSPLWFLSRGSGVVVLVLLTVVVVLGVVTRRGTGARGLTFVAGAVHRNASLLAVALLAVHVGTAVLDPYAPIRWLDAVVPFGSAYRPLWLGLGALALDLLVALVLTSLLRQRLGLRRWRLVHWTAYLAWPVAVVHGAGTGSDATTWWSLALTAACAVAVAMAVVLRIRLAGDRLRVHGVAVRGSALPAGRR